MIRGERGEPTWKSVTWYWYEHYPNSACQTCLISTFSVSLLLRSTWQAFVLTMSYDKSHIPVFTLACIDQHDLKESQWCMCISCIFPEPCKMPHCHTWEYNNGILTSKWENVLGKYRGYWFSQSKWDHVKIACLMSLCQLLLMCGNFIRALHLMWSRHTTAQLISGMEDLKYSYTVYFSP